MQPSGNVGMIVPTGTAVPDLVYGAAGSVTTTVVEAGCDDAAAAPATAAVPTTTAVLLRIVRRATRRVVPATLPGVSGAPIIAFASFMK